MVLSCVLLVELNLIEGDVSCLQKKGDLGLVAKESRSSQPMIMMFKPEVLTIRKVFNTFRLIAKVCYCRFLNIVHLGCSLIHTTSYDPPCLNLVAFCFKY